MDFELDLYDVGLVGLGLAMLLGAWLPVFFTRRPMTLAVIYLAGGAVLFSLPVGLPAPDPVAHGVLAERLTELVVIISLMGVGLKLDRVIDLTKWGSTWRLLAIAMPLTIAGTALAGWWTLGLTVPAAVLLGAAMAPTDPVLASDVQVRQPNEGGEDEVRFSLTSEAGLNDGLAFPFTWLAILLVTHEWNGGALLGEWFLRDVLYRTTVGVLSGVIVGWVIGRVLFRKAPGAQAAVAHIMEGSIAFAATIVAYGLTEIAHGYGFIAVFVAACAIRRSAYQHEFHEELAGFVEGIERVLMATVLLLLGGVAVTMANVFTWQTLGLALAVLLVIRPLAGWVSMLGRSEPWQERLAISAFGIRGIGTLYYLAFGLNHAGFGDEAATLWGAATLTVVLSAAGHGLTATPLMIYLDKLREASGEADRHHAGGGKPSTSVDG